jgi:putative DNA-invertase from lambdoid prophage Rac
MAKQRGWQVVEYADTGSGKTRTNLPERDRMMVDARRGLIDVVVVWRFDRFARSSRDLVDALESFKAWGVAFVSLHEGIDTSTTAGKLVFTIFAAIAEFERELIRERVAAGMQTARNKGVRLGRPHCIFHLDKALRLLDEGQSLRAVAKKAGISPRTLKRRIELRRQKGTPNPVAPPPAKCGGSGPGRGRGES